MSHCARAARTLTTSLMKVVGYLDAEHLASLHPWPNVSSGRGDICSAGIDRNLFGHVLPNFRQQFARAVRFRYIVIAAGHSRLLSFTAERIGGDCDDRD